MYLPNDDSVRRAKAFALALVGSFVFILASVVVLNSTHQLAYLALAGLSLCSVVLVYFAVRSFSVPHQVVDLLGASAALAAETSVVMLYFPATEGVAYALTTLVGSSLSLKGIRDIEISIAAQPYPRRRREVPAVQEDQA